MRFLPSLFDKKPKDEPVRATGVVVHEIKVYNSELWCDQCPDFAEEGVYQPESKRLTFVCPNGHDNVVGNIDL